MSTNANSKPRQKSPAAESANSGKFFTMNRAVMRDSKFLAMPIGARWVVVRLADSWDGTNNGHLFLTAGQAGMMRKHLNRNLQIACDAGFIALTRKGERGRARNLYALLFDPLGGDDAPLREMGRKETLMGRKDPSDGSKRPATEDSYTEDSYTEDRERGTEDF